MEIVSISQVINHMTCYNFRALSLVENLFVKKNLLQDLLSSLNAVISTNERTQIYNRFITLLPTNEKVLFGRIDDNIFSLRFSDL